MAIETHRVICTFPSVLPRPSWHPSDGPVSFETFSCYFLLPDSETDSPAQAEEEEYVQDRRVLGYEPLVQPALLLHEIPVTPSSRKTISAARQAAARILSGKDDRVLVIVGPCSIHSAEQAVEYANLLKAKIPDWENLLIIMRAYLCVVYAES